MVLWPQDKKARAVVGRAAEHRGARRESAWAWAGARPLGEQLRAGAGAGQTYPNCKRFKTRHESTKTEQTKGKKKIIIIIEFKMKVFFFQLTSYNAF